MTTVVIIAKKHPSDIINNINVKNSYKNILPSNKDYSEENKKYIYILCKELIKEGIIKKGEEGSEIIEEILYIAEMSNKKKDIINIKDEELIKEINNYIIIAKEKGFESKVWKNKNEIITSLIYSEWLELCKEDSDNLDNYEEEIVKEDEKERIICNNILSYSFDIQIQFINKLKNMLSNSKMYPDEFNCFKTRRNGVFLYLYLPFFFEIYRFEQIFPLFLMEIENKHNIIIPCYEYLIKLYNDIIERMEKESEEKKEMNEGTIGILLFILIVKKEERKKLKEIECLINLITEVFEWIGKIEEEIEEIEEKEKVIESKEDKKEQETEEIVNRKEMIMFRLLDIIKHTIYEYSVEENKKIKKDGRIGKVLLEIAKNHLENEKCLIEKGNKKKIIEYIIYSYNRSINTPYLLSISSYSFPFSTNTIMNITFYIKEFLVNNDYQVFLKKDIIKICLKYILFSVYLRNIINETDIKNEIEIHMNMKCDDEVINNLKRKTTINWFYLVNIFPSYFSIFDISSFDKENEDIFKKISVLFFKHCNNYICNKEKVKEIRKEKEGTMFLKPFIMDNDNRKHFIQDFIYFYASSYYYSITDIYYSLINSDEGCNFISIYMKELSGEIVDRIERRRENNKRIQRRRYERERICAIFDYILFSLSDVFEYTYVNRNNKNLGDKKNKESYKGRKDEVEKDKQYIKDLIEEEDTKECLLLFVKHLVEYFNSENKKIIVLSGLSSLSSYDLTFFYCYVKKK